MTTWHVFQAQLEAYGFGESPNGASYRIVPDNKDGRFAVERSMNGRRETIVADYHGNTFDSLPAAREWAKYDGRFVMMPQGTPINKRPMVQS